MGLLRLTRPANVVTAISDIFAGIAISGYFFTAFNSAGWWVPVLLLIIVTKCLYAGGVVFNDVFDATLDAKERPERPIPSGVVTLQQAGTWGAILLTGGIIAAAFVQEKTFSITLFLAIAIAISTLLYDKWAKHHAIAGPLMMGLCRGLNLLLGISIIPSAITTYWFLALVPMVYIAAITTVSRGEVHGGDKRNLYLATVLYALVIITLFVFSIQQQHWQTAIIIIAAFGGMIIPPLLKALQQPVGSVIGKAVKAGVIGLILMNAAWAAAFGQFYFACIIVLLLPISLFLARVFAVT